MRKILSMLVLLAIPSLAMADDMILQILQSDGQVYSINLNDEPVTTYSDGNLVIKTKKTTITYPLEKVSRYTYVSASGIEAPEAVRASFSQNGEELFLKGLKPGTKVMLYNLAGQLLRNVGIGDRGSCSVSVSDLPVGVYVVKVNDVTYKITKR